MAATTSKKRKVTRKTGKKYSWVTFELEQYDGEFVLPDMKHLPLKVVDALNRGAVGVLVGWMEEAKVGEDYIDAIWELEQNEVEDFVKAWGEGSLVDAPKSKD